MQSTIKQFVRDWSKDGRAERDMCYGPIIQELERLFPLLETRSDTKVRFLDIQIWQ